MRKRLFLNLISVFIVALTAAAALVLQTSAAAVDYGLDVGGKRVTSDRLSGEGWKFEPDTNTLTLNGFISDVADKATFMKYDKKTHVYYYAFIRVENSMNLNIKLEGKESTIGDPYISGHAAERIGNTDSYNTFYGIYNPNGNVTVTGSARLKVYTNLRGISASKLTMDSCTGGIMMGAYTNCIDLQRLIVKGGTKITASCGYGGAMKLMYNTPIHASKSIDIYDTSEVYSEIERDNDTDDYGISGIYCDGTINVYGGKLTAISYAQGKKPTVSVPANVGINAETLNISGGGVVEAYVKQGSDQKNYLRSAGICYIYPSNGTINFKGSGVLRAGVEKSNPDGIQRVIPKDPNLADGIAGITTAVSKDGYEKYLEYAAYGRDGIYLRKVGSGTYWSYYNHPTLAINSYSGTLNLNDLIIKNTDLSIHSVSGGHKLDPYTESGEIPAITVESGELLLEFSEGKTYNFTKPIEVKSGATLRIYGLGIVNGLDIRGEGTVDFMAGTIAGKAQKSLKVIVEGGSINVDYDGQATDAKGTKVWRQAYTLGGDGETFSTVTQISVKNDRLYFRPGIYPINGKTVYLWMQSPEELESLSAMPSGSSPQVTLKGQPGNPLWLTSSQSIEAYSRSLYTATPEMTVNIQPFTKAPTAEQMKDYKLIWSYSDDDMNWTTINNPNCDNECRLIYTVPNEAWKNRTFRCELRTADTNQQVGVYTAVLHIFNPKLICENSFSEGKMTTLALTEEILPPGGQSAEFKLIRWYINKGDGNFNLHKESNGKNRYSFNITENMDGWVYRCVATQTDGTNVTGELAAEITVNVTDRWVKLTEQPQSQTVKYPAGATLSVKAKYAEKYQWQVSRRSYAGENVPFEDIAGANGEKYVFSASSSDVYVSTAHYAYRCVVSNDFSKVISDEVTLTLLYNPYLKGWKGQRFTVVEDDTLLFESDILPGNPIVATSVCWKVRKAGGSENINVSELEELRGIYKEENISETTNGITYYTKCSLRVDKAAVDMNGWIFLCELTYGEESSKTYADFYLTVRTKCRQNGHDWLAATCTAPKTCSRCGITQGEMLPHTGGKATCIDLAICEVCGNEYGNLDPNTHPDDATDVWNEEEWHDNAGHHSKWSCCGKPKYPYEYHKWDDGICTVCGCICEHSISSPANCHERARCHTCGIEYGQIDPHNHDFYPSGTYTSGEKEPTCTEEGYTGDTVCWNCHGVVDYGTVIPAKGHDTSRWKANCREPAYCSVCKQYCGEKDPDNHTSSPSDYKKTPLCHEQHWDCCGKTVAELHDYDENGVCRACLYGCKHSGGEATCREPARCEKCSTPYGEIDPDNHINAEYEFTDEIHKKTCMCGALIIPAGKHTWENGICTVCEYECRHTGGKATCTEEAVCNICGESYGGKAEHNYGGWAKNSEKHWHECLVCGNKTDEAAHTPGDPAADTAPQLCTVCNHEITPASDHSHTFTQNTDEKYLKSAATCTQKAVYYLSCSCGVAGSETFEYGETSAHTYKDDWSTDTSCHWHECSVCGEKKDSEEHEPYEHACNICYKILSICADENNDNRCDICGRMLSKPFGYNDIRYIGSDPTGTVIALETSTVNYVWGVGCDLEILTANGTEKFNCYTDYVNTNALGKKPWLAFRDKVYYCDVDNDGSVDTAADMAALKKLLLEGKVAINADINGDLTVDIRDLIKFKKIASEIELTPDAPFENYTYAFNVGDALSVDGIQSVIYKPYCIVDGLKMYGTEYALDSDKLNFPAPANDGVRGIAEKRAKY